MLLFVYIFQDLLCLFATFGAKFCTLLHAWVPTKVTYSNTFNTFSFFFSHWTSEYSRKVKTFKAQKISECRWCKRDLYFSEEFEYTNGIKTTVANVKFFELRSLNDLLFWNCKKVFKFQYSFGDKIRYICRSRHIIIIIIARWHFMFTRYHQRYKHFHYY